MKKPREVAKKLRRALRGTRLKNNPRKEARLIDGAKFHKIDLDD